MAKVTHVKKAQKDIAGTDIKKGDSYFWWQFRYGTKQCSKVYPKRSQLTQSNFLSQLYELEDRLSEFTADSKDDFDSFKEEFLSDIENLKDECQSSLDNMPEQLQSAPTGELLQERIDALDSWYSEIENIECEEGEDGGDGDQSNDELLENAITELQETSSGL